MSGLEISQTTPPETNEIEISIFGPGFGESLVVHLGDGIWVIVDSCRDLGSDGDNAALSYLESIGVDPGSSVKLVVLTHWHDDHIKGASEIIKACPGAALSITSAFSQRDFRAALAPWIAQDSEKRGGNGLGEIRKIGPILKNLTPIPASNNKVLFSRKKPFRCEVKALSPSDKSVFACVASLLEIPKEERVGKIPKIHGNHTSVVLSIEIEGRRILLGGDLEVQANNDHGWLAVIDSHVQSGEDPYELLKISHHGSHNGDHPDIWTQMMAANPHSLVAPFVKGKVMLPRDVDISRILARTNRAWITAAPKGVKFRSGDRLLQKQMEARARKILEIPRGFGQVRLRSNRNSQVSDWTVEKFGHACELSEAL